MSVQSRGEAWFSRLNDWAEQTTFPIGYLSILGLLVLWQLGALLVTSSFGPPLIPRVEVVAVQLYTMLVTEGTAYSDIFATLFRVFVGFTAAIVVGIPIGLWMGSDDRVEFVLDPLISTLYPIPRIAFYPLLLAILGLGHAPKLVIIFIESLIPILLGSYYGVQSVSKLHIWSGKNFGASRTQIFRDIVLPASLPYIFSGIRMAMPIALIVTVVTELVASSQGIGYLIIRAQGSFEYETVFAGVVLISILGIVFDQILARLRERLLFWAGDVSIDM
ncbi:ABC transporter permease [Haloferax larsenii]|uniref:NitT/TauT family transport system permease protein n=1 Tax=Haloferax larsenii TaxID=302484 RepID=A0A1H7NM82_HALLR|nr:ABC transporter permease [Haloferax larsenii]SEL24027.1 NitT/TauT family transport system permease protein [Haloferax larsenii]